MHVLLRIVDDALNVACDIIDKPTKSDRVVQGEVVMTSSNCCVQIMNKQPDDLLLVHIGNEHL